MKLFGSLRELVGGIFRKDSQEITLRPNQSTTYTASRDIQLPADDEAHVLVSRTSTDTGAARLQSKDLDDDSCGFVDSGDTTKRVEFEASGSSTGTTTTLATSSTTSKTLTLPNFTTTLLGTDSAQVVTAKDIDGGTASNTSRITLPKATTVTLNGLTRKEATIVYDTDTAQAKIDTGSTLQALLTAGNSGAQNDLISIDQTAGNVTIPSGQTSVHPNLIVASGHTYTVNGSLMTLGRPITGPGVLAGTGTIY